MEARNGKSSYGSAVIIVGRREAIMNTISKWNVLPVKNKRSFRRDENSQIVHVIISLETNNLQLSWSLIILGVYRSLRSEIGPPYTFTSCPIHSSVTFLPLQTIFNHIGPFSLWSASEKFPNRSIHVFVLQPKIMRIYDSLRGETYSVVWSY